MPENLVGQTFAGRYRILELLGSGGMGVVYRARDDRLERDVAVKVLAPGVLDDERIRKRFRREALALSRLNHPNIAAVYDFLTESGHDLIVMELVPGPTLDQKLAQGPLAPRDTLALGKQLAEALAAAHQEGVIHRDLKPANLRFTGDQRLKVLDFGLAEVQTGPNAQLTTASFRSDSSVSGTLPYMAPEQLRGDPPDVRSDIYAAGAVLYEMATGKRAFPQGGYVIVDAILNQVPQPPSQLNPQLSPGLENAIMKALDKNPGYRYQTARDLLAELERLTSSTSTASIPRAPYPAPQSRRRWWAVTAIALFLFFVLPVILFYWAEGRQRAREAQPPPQERAQSPEVVASNGAATSDQGPTPATKADSTSPAATRHKESAKKAAPPAGAPAAPAVPSVPAINVPRLDAKALREAIRAERALKDARNAQAGEDDDADPAGLPGREGSARGLVGMMIGGAAMYKTKLGYYPSSLPVLFQFLREERAASGRGPGAPDDCPVEPCMRGGYTFSYRRLSPQSYAIQARPIAYPFTGRRSFYADQSGAIRSTEQNRAATAQDPLLR